MGELTQEQKELLVWTIFQLSIKMNDKRITKQEFVDRSIKAMEDVKDYKFN